MFFETETDCYAPFAVTGGEFDLTLIQSKKKCRTDITISEGGSALLFRFYVEVSS